MEIIAKKEVYVAWTNTDTTEGRGDLVHVCVCNLKETAERLGKGKGVQGRNATVVKSLAVKLKGDAHWLIPGCIILPSSEDKILHETRTRVQLAVEKARELGLSEDEITLLKNQ